MIQKLLLIALVISTTSCISAGDTVVRCYSRLYADEKKVVKELNDFWEKYPENRVDGSTIRKIQKVYPRMFVANIFVDTSSSGCVQSYVFKSVTVNEDFKREEWYVKSADGRMVFIVDIANKGEWINGFNCDLCLMRVLFMDKVNLNFRNWELSSKEKKDARATFENDVLVKLKKVLSESK
ncbi:hypothetical protein [uncultured Acetobacteroides sp.]|uniref:hypothetical protein n=1 Tax=uncultured Acetobacteroides sp. TaxID=1760811 RepID=UPI0029F56D63|nr:hypothetical protein [uncultured Acetobacteroides sp.]